MKRCGRRPRQSWDPASIGLPPLLRSRVREPTLKRYQQIVQVFLFWLLKMGVIIHTITDLDGALVHYAHSGAVTKSNFNLTFAAVAFLASRGGRHVAVRTRGIAGLEPLPTSRT